MRAAFFLLLLVNLLFFVWSAGYLGGQDEGREPGRLQRQLQPEKMTVAPVAVAAAVETPQLACRHVDGVPARDVAPLQQALQESGLVAAVLAFDQQAYRVMIPALPTRVMADKKAGELKYFGITDFEIVPDDNNFAILLGKFQDETTAAQFLQELNSRGVKSARIEMPTTMRVEVRGAADILDKRLPELLAGTATAVDCR